MDLSLIQPQTDAMTRRLVSAVLLLTISQSYSHGAAAAASLVLTLLSDVVRRVRTGGETGCSELKVKWSLFRYLLSPLEPQPDS